ncbi:MAG: VirB4-like conjugal transfer ATPase, CD1110 family [Chloroflexota bacterium]
MTAVAAQTRLDLVALEGGVACFGTRSSAHAVALLDVVGAEAALASADDATQEELLAGRVQFLNAQTSPFQVLLRAEPVDLDGHLGRVQARVELLPAALRAIALDYIAFLQALAQQRTLLERHCYVVLPDHRAELPAVSLSRRLQHLVGWGGHAESSGDSEMVSTSVARRLQARIDLVARQLGRSGLRTRRLESHQVAELLHRCWSPELARVQRLRDELGAYTSLVVSSRQIAHPLSDNHEPPGIAEQTDSDDEDTARLFALGTRTLADLIAPSGCEVRADHLQLDGQYTRVLVVTAYPRLVTPGWLSLLVETDLPIEVSVHVSPLASAEMVRTLGVQIARLQSSRLAALRGERIADPEREIALEDAERLRERLQRGEERLFAVSLYLLLRAKALRELDELTRRVEEQLDALLAHSRRALWEQERGFRSCLPEARDQLLVPRNLDTSALAATLPFVGPSLAMESGMLVGLARTSQTPVLLDPFDRSLDNANLVVVAPAGAGKSFFTKLLVLRQLINGTDCIAVDPENEFSRIAEAADGQVVRLAASSAHRINPFDLPPPAANVGEVLVEVEEDPLAERVTALLGLLEVMLCGSRTLSGRSGSLDNHERAILDRAIYRTYAQAGITADVGTHSRSAPLMSGLHSVLEDTPGEVAASLTMRLERYVEGSLSTGLFAGPTNVELDRKLVVFNIQQLEDELRPLAIHLIAGWVWTRVRRDRRPRLLVIDEAWSLLSFAEGGAFVAAMARRARKYYLGLVTITQQVADLADDGHGETILSNAAQVLLLKQKADTIDAATTRFRLTSDERQLLLGADKGEGLLLVRGNRIPLQVVASKAEYRLATTNPRDLEDFAAAAAAVNAPVATRVPPSNGAGQGSVGAVLTARRAVRGAASSPNG